MSDNFSQVNSISEGDVRGILYDILRDWWIPIAVAISVCLIATTIADMTYKPEYTSSLTVAVTSKDTTSTVYDSLGNNAGTAEVLSNIFASTTMKKLVSDDLGIDEFNARVNTSVISSTNLISVSVTADDPRMAYIILNSIMDNYPLLAEHIIERSMLEVLEESQLPYGPSNYVNINKVKKNSFWIGFFATVLLLAFLSYVRDDIKTEEDIANKLDIKLFAIIPHEKKYKTIKENILRPKKSVIISNVSASYLFVESFYKLRTKLEYIMSKNGYKVLLVTSVLENEGKSSVAANIALSLAAGGKKVTLVDCDLRNPSQYKLFGVKPANSKDFAGYLSGIREKEDIVQTEERFGLNMIMSYKSRSNSVELISGKNMQNLIEELRESMDYVILDTSPMLVTADAERLSRFADASLMVVKQNCSKAININDMTDQLNSYNCELLGCVFNNVRSNLFTNSQKYYYGKGRYSGKYERKYDIEVPAEMYGEQSGGQRNIDSGSKRDN